MEKINRGRLTISANIVLTASLITRTFTFGFIMMLILMKANNDILNEDVIKIVDIEILAGMPLGTTVKSIVFSFIGVFFLELVAGIFGIWGVIGRKKRVVAVNVLMSSIMIVVYLIYIVLLSIIYDKKADLKETLKNYTSAYQDYFRQITYSTAYQDQVNTFETFLEKLGCNNSVSVIYDCGSVYVQKLDTYLEIYIGVIVTCILCQIVTIVAAEYTFRKLEFKEKKSSISKNTYYILLSLKLGIFRSMIIFIKDNWKRSKVVVASVTLKISSLAAGLGHFVLGLTLIGDIFISDGSLRHIFYKLQFYNYYFYDILSGLAAASVVIGLLTSSVAVLGLVGSWKKSPRILGTSSVLSLVLHIPRCIAVILWIVFIEKINGDMRFELQLQQSGYFYGGNGNKITENWNDMIMKLHCCGVYYANDTRTTQGKQFCCRNAHPSIMNSNDPNTLAYSALLESLFGGCGDYKTETCADAILVKTRMFVAWFLAIVLLQIVLEIIAVIFVNKEYSVILLTERTDKSIGKALNSKSVLFRMMFRGIKSFCVSNWKRSKMTMVHLISLGSLFICNLVVLCLAINIRYDKVFGNSDIQELFSRISIANYYNFMKTINVFSIVNATFSSVSIANVIFSIVLLVLPKWKRVLSFVSIELLCILAVGNFIQVGLFMKFFSNVSSGLDDRLMNQFNTSDRYNGGYDYSDYSATHESSSSLSWNTLFVQAECCGVGPRIESSFKSTYWYLHGDSSVGEDIPVQCCISQSNVFPYSTSRDVRCNSPILEGYFHSQSCDVAVNIRLRIYSTVFIVFMAIIILAEICCVVTTLLNAKRFKQDATILNRSKKPSGEDTEMRKNDKTQKEKDNARKKRKHGDKEAKGLPRNKKQRSVGTVEIHQKANTIVQENAGENIELQMMKSMEIEDTVNTKPDKPNNKRRQDDLAEKDLTMLDN